MSRKVKVEVIDTWLDDHILCCTVSIGGTTIDLLWCGYEGAAAAEYANESPRAVRVLKRQIRGAIKLVSPPECVEDQKKINGYRAALRKLEAMG